MENCKLCDVSFEKPKRGKKLFCSHNCRVKWHYHNNEEYREKQILHHLTKYYENPGEWNEKLLTYDKTGRENVRRGDKNTFRRHLFVENEPDWNVVGSVGFRHKSNKFSKSEDKPFDPLVDGFSNVDFGFDFGVSDVFGATAKGE